MRRESSFPTTAEVDGGGDCTIVGLATGEDVVPPIGLTTGAAVSSTVGDLVKEDGGVTVGVIEVGSSDLMVISVCTKRTIQKKCV